MKSTSPASEVPTAHAILDEAERLIQTLGYNKFSYADIASTVGIRTASIHYYFPSKADLGRQVIERYRRRNDEKLANILATHPSLARRLDSYIEVFAELLRRDFLMCPGGMLAVEFMGLPGPIQEELRRFFRDHEKWLQLVLATGKEELSDFASDRRCEDLARYLLAGLEGGLMMARLYGDNRHFRGVADQLIAPLAPHVGGE